MGNPRYLLGFTLIELSIVLVIIGLIAGGVLFGRDMIKSAQNRAFMSQIEQMDTAVNTFKTKYNCIPGDCTNGTQFGFGGNGNGNGLVTSLWNNNNNTYVDNGNTAPVQRPYYNGTTGEGYRFFNSLLIANLIPSLTSFNNGRLPKMVSSEEGIGVGAWSGLHYYRTGINFFNGNTVVGYPCRNSFSPADALYIASKYGQNTYTTTNGAGNGDPDSVAQGDKVIILGIAPVCPSDAGYNYPATAGAGGATANVCLDTSTTPTSLNVANEAKLCSLMIRAGF